MKTMKALTLRHPWAFAICYWGKRIENRKWWPVTALKVGQRFAIHGALPPTTRGNRQYVLDTAKELIERFGFPPKLVEQYGGVKGAALEDLVIRGIVATAVLKEIVTKSDDPWFEGPIGWVLEDVRVLKTPIPCGGAQGLWTVPADVLSQIEQASLTESTESTKAG